MTDQLADLDDAGAGDDEAGTTALVPAATAIGRWRERRRTRVSKWDRPPDPHDWRFFVGGLGKVLIATGLLMFGFVAYQLWGTGIETARAQADLEDAFQEQVQAITEGDEPDVGIQSWELPDDVAGVDALGGEVDPEEIVATLLQNVELSEVVPGGQDLSDFAVDQDVPIIPGDSFARVEIPAIGISEYIVPGVKLTDLKRGPGHYPDTPLPGQLGNAAIAGHRTTYGAPFFDLDQLGAGDEIEVTMVTGDRFVYRVTGIEIVSASDYWVVTTRDPNVAELTLTTCHPKYTARDRLVVHSVLVPEKSAQVGEAEFYQLDDSEPDETIPGDDPTLALDESALDDPALDDPALDDPGIGVVVDPDAGVDLTGDGLSDEDATEPTAVPTTALAEPVTEPTAVPTTALAEPVTEPTTADLTDTRPGSVVGDETELDEIDAFSQGWFDDWDAWPQIALWGLALTIISLLAYQVSKKTRHDSIGFLVGIAPFLFCLYFFFQNINRLLPPGL